MKLIQGILGCALATGLMTFAADQAQAGVVIGSQLYSPLTIKLTIGTYSSKGAIKKVSVTSKQILKMLNFPKSAQLAIIDGTVNNNSIYIISKDSVLENLTAQGILTANLNELLDNPTEGKNGAFKYASTGILSLNLYSDPRFVSNTNTALTLVVNNPNVDQEASEIASDYWFEISGLYSYSEKGSAIKNNDRNIVTSLKAPVLSGPGYDVDLDAADPTTVKGSVSSKGNGKVPAISIY